MGALDATHRELAALTGLAVVGPLGPGVDAPARATRALRRAADLALACTAAQIAVGLVLTGRGAAAAGAGAAPVFASLMLGALTATAFIAWRWAPPADARLTGMFADPLFAAFLSFTLVFVATPGATTAVVVRNAIDGGRRAGLWAAPGAAVANAHACQRRRAGRRALLARVAGGHRRRFGWRAAATWRGWACAVCGTC